MCQLSQVFLYALSHNYYVLLQVEIVVRDINDNVPFFIDLSREFSVAETASPSSRLGQIRAIDNDFGRNGQITYSLQEDPSSFSGSELITI